MKHCKFPAITSRVIFVVVGFSMCSAAFAAEAPANSTFTEDQFERGESLYQQHCAICHGVELDGAAAPVLLGTTFRKTWSRLGANVAELYNRIVTTMPPQQMGELDEAQNLDVLAYILGRNNVLQGTERCRTTMIT